MAVSKQDITIGAGGRDESLVYIVQMLGELHRLAEGRKYDMLCYLLEMAYIEANEIQVSSRD